MILNKEQLSLAEVNHYIKDLDEKKVLSDYLKKFSPLDFKKAQKFKEEIRALNNPKIKDAEIVKILDFLPKDAEDVNKIFLEVALTEDEINAVLNIAKNY